MKRAIILFMLITALMASALPVLAQGSGQDGPPYRVEVRVESAFVRAAPSLDAAPSASVFNDDLLDVVGRSLDGSWFEVRRAGRFFTLGWINRRMVRWDFAIETLPLTDLVTGVEGPQPLQRDPGRAVWVLDNATLRAEPSLRGERITTVAHSSAVPLLYRNQDGSWLLVNYFGYQGWIADFTTRIPADLEAVPVAPGLPPLQTAPLEVIPVELQMGQLNRLREFITLRRDVADGLAGFWWLVSRGQTLPCNPPALVTEFLYTPQDIRELPELRRYAPRVNEGVDYLNASIAVLQNCGIVDPGAAAQARNDAINAGVIFDATLDVLDLLEADVIRP